MDIVGDDRAEAARDEATATIDLIELDIAMAALTF